MSKHLSELKIARVERRHLCGGSKAHKRALRSFNRARRRAGKALCRSHF